MSDMTAEKASKCISEKTLAATSVHSCNTEGAQPTGSKSLGSNLLKSKLQPVVLKENVIPGIQAHGLSWASIPSEFNFDKAEYGNARLKCEEEKHGVTTECTELMGLVYLPVDQRNMNTATISSDEQASLRITEVIPSKSISAHFDVKRCKGKKARTGIKLDKMLASESKHTILFVEDFCNLKMRKLNLENKTVVAQEIIEGEFSGKHGLQDLKVFEPNKEINKELLKEIGSYSEEDFEQNCSENKLVKSNDEVFNDESTTSLVILKGIPSMKAKFPRTREINTPDSQLKVTDIRRKSILKGKESGKNIHTGIMPMYDVSKESMTSTKTLMQVK